uniref:Uncharacterized protein n=1 Tax=viral metagenome TaxID=1070528 RepID=A0A6C0D7H4_9ZZZZ
MTNNFVINNPLTKMKSRKLHRNKGSRFLIPKTRFSNNIEERYIPYDNKNNYKLPLNYFSGRKGFRGKHRESINTDKSNMSHMPSDININTVSKYRKNTLQKLKNKKNYFLDGGVIEKTNPLFEKKLQNLYNERKDFVKTLNIRNRKNMTKLNTLDFKIKEYVKNGYHGLRTSTRKIMKNLSNNLRV